MADLTNEQKVALDHARHLAENGAPIFVARRNNSSLGFRLPDEWQQTAPDPAAVDRWKPGMALCLVTGVLVDAIDIDPRNGGDRAALNGTMPTTYGQQSTPSGGTHYLVAPLGVAKGTPLPGIDVQAGDVNGDGRGFVFLAPTERPSKVTGEVRAYEWTVAPEVGMLLVEDDDSGDGLRSLMLAKATTTYDGPNYDGPTYDELTDAQKQWADRHVADVADYWRAKFADAVEWPDGENDDHGRGWEAMSRDCAWALAMLAVCPWTGLDEDDAAFLYDAVLPAEIAGNEKCQGKWSAALVAKAATRPVEPPPWGDFDPVPDDSEDAAPKASVNVANESAALGWLEAEIGRGRLSGVFRRAQELVHTPRIGEDGYVPPRDDRDSSGPAQVRRIDALELARRIDHGYEVARVTKKSTTPCLFPQAVAARAAAAPDLLRTARDLSGVTHTPVVRGDGTILDQPGYDDRSGILYLPDPSLSVPPVSGRPTSAEVQGAGRMLLDVVADFPFVTIHDRANYFGAMLTPLLRPLVPPPYKLVAIGAPQRGSGKSLLASILRDLHGGVFKSEFPSGDDELRKFVTSTLDATTGPVVQFDNVTGVLKSSVLDGLLTSAAWSDRLLGASTVLNLHNDRLWVVTGNNVHIGGDLERRTLWVTINANMERPEERSKFTIQGDLSAYVHTHRGDLLWALLTLIRAWVVRGRPVPQAPTSDSFGQWVAVLRGILEVARLGDDVGVVGHADSAQGKADPEDEEWAAFLAAVHGLVGSKPWTASELLDHVVDEDDEFGAKSLAEGGYDHGRAIGSSALPGDLADRVKFGKSRAAKSLGKWLGFRDGRWAGGLSVQHVGDRKGTKVWRVVDTSALG